MITPDHDTRNYSGRRITILGLGTFGGGVGAARFFGERGAILTISDHRTKDELSESLAELQGLPVARWSLGGHLESDITDAELICVNPAIRPDHPLVQLAKSRGIARTSEINLFVQHQRGTVLGVTGSNGKSTTTAMLHSIAGQTARRAGSRCWLGGNLGGSLLSEVDRIAPGDLVVLELSSFQLADLDRLQFSPHVSVVTNFAPNHLDWHSSLDDYRLAKQSILRWQSSRDFAVLNQSDPDVFRWETASSIRYFDADPAEQLIEPGWLNLPGAHNRANACAAARAAQCVGATIEDIQAGLQSFQGLPHRLELVREYQGRKFYNDSLATTPESAIIALQAFEVPIVLLAGGYDKGVDLSAFGKEIARQAHAVSLMGATGPIIGEVVTRSPENRCRVSPAHSSFAEAFQWALEMSNKGDVVLLSPGCASFGWFRNFADRGSQFRKLVESLGE